MTAAKTCSKSQEHPYGEEITGTSNDTFKFAQTYRDSDSGLDYVQQRYYTSLLGRFLTVDQGGNDPTVPQRWNRYSYAMNDPANMADVNGMDPCNVTFCITVTSTYPDPEFWLRFLMGGGGGSNESGTNPTGFTYGDKRAIIKDKADALKNAKTYLQPAKDAADKALTDPNNPDCAGLFGTKDGMTAAQVFEGKQQGVSWNIQFSYNPNNENVATTRPTISLNNIGGFTSFVTKINDTFQDSGYWNAGGTTDNAETLIHELGHVLRFLGFKGGDFVQNDNDPAVGLQNDKLIYDKCFGQKTP
jgi:RHS repeat-associated protein